MRREQADARSRKLLSHPRAKPALLSTCGKVGNAPVSAGSRQTGGEGLQRQPKPQYHWSSFGERTGSWGLMPEGAG